MLQRLSFRMIRLNESCISDRRLILPGFVIFDICPSMTAPDISVGETIFAVNLSPSLAVAVVNGWLSSMISSVSFGIMISASLTGVNVVLT